jgi:long-chain acyl-CoA synthetase
MTAPIRTVPDLLAWRRAAHPDQVAIEVHGHATLTFAEWEDRSGQVATALRLLGVARGDAVGLFFGARDWTGFAAAYCGVLRAGAVAVPLSDRLAGSQLGYALDHCGATLLIHGDRATPPADAGARPVPLSTLLGADDHDHPRARPAERAQILYTSGTTGRPKGVAATHANLTLGAPTHLYQLTLAHSTRFVHTFPIGTNAGQTMLFNALTAKPRSVTLPRFSPARFARLIAASPPAPDPAPDGRGRRPVIGTTVFLVPAMAIELLDSGALDGLDLGHVSLVGSTAAALPPAVAARLASAFPKATIVNYYSSTEAAPAQTVMIYDPARRAALGKPASGDLMIADPDGDPLPAGEFGEVWLRAAVPRAYVGDAEADRMTFRNGWVRMGDIGRLDADGYLYLADRSQDVIKSGAYKISTLEVEAALHEHPLVAEAAVVAVPHPVLGSSVAAVLVPRPSAPPDELALPALRGFLAGRLADYQLPARVLLVDRLPRNEGGKVLKRELADRFDR